MSRYLQLRNYLLLRRVDVKVLLAAIVVFALVTADVVSGGLLTHLDTEIREQLIAHGLTAPGTFWPLGDLGDLGVAIAIVGAAAAVASQLRWKVWPAVFALGSLGCTEALILVSKTLVARPGPGVWADREDYPGYFPSGHTATAMVVVGVVAYLALVTPESARYRDRAAEISLVVGAIAGTAAGIYAVLGDFHWVSDIVGGLALGAAVLVISCASVRTHRDAPESVEHAR
jgi:membrane-associated phospholipid phosphatase